MKNQCKSLDTRRVEELLQVARDIPTLGGRIAAISAELVDCPYHVSPLVGSSTEREEVTAALDSFDCVTLVETVLALATSKNVEDFIPNLVRLRYENGEVSWEQRNHYSVDWIRRNEEQGLVQNVTPIEQSICKERTLSILENYPARTHTIRYLPTDKLKDIEQDLQTGDLVYFGTSMENLDVTHVGILIRDEEGLTLRHSTKSKGCTVNESLDDFLERFGATPGLILVRPCG